ncbi:MAG: hypothetical protein JRH13_14085 [Deltaproteobacteria bacterium]|nr:hypothetical protein [Deltaproteobacteria bacterium]MBW2016596.1 hypothetical protein [Deltaproteobacteria bacterium]MBW2130480.1 hypothetical protein [Deltaproteobacteria bacterium]MBW2303129.1 hypothetical protein [Deltaproteobacteria bacterium]
MRSYLMDEILPADIEKAKAFLMKNTLTAQLDNLFWVPLPEDYLSEIQSRHISCQPHVFAVEIGKDWIKMEFFVRSLKVMRCDCQSYCTSRQSAYIMSFGNQIVRELGIRT